MALGNGVESQLQLNTSKTKAMEVDFRRNKPTLLLLSIRGANVEVVRTYNTRDCCWMTDWTGQHLQEGAEPPLHSEEVGIFQHLQKTATDVFPVCIGQCQLVTVCTTLHQTVLVNRFSGWHLDLCESTKLVLFIVFIYGFYLLFFYYWWWLVIVWNVCGVVLLIIYLNS